MIAFTVRVVAWLVVVILPLLLLGIVGKKREPSKQREMTFMAL